MVGAAGKWQVRDEGEGEGDDWKRGLGEARGYRRREMGAKLSGRVNR